MALPRKVPRKAPLSPGFCCRTRNLRCESSGTPDEFPTPRDAKPAALRAAGFSISLCGASAGETTAFSECAFLGQGLILFRLSHHSKAVPYFSLRNCFWIRRRELRGGSRKKLRRAVVLRSFFSFRSSIRYCYSYHAVTYLPGPSGCRNRITAVCRCRQGCRRPRRGRGH